MASLLPFTTKDAKAPPPAAPSDSSSGFMSLFSESQTPDPWLPSLTRKQRVIGFFSCLGGALLCFALAFVFLPVIYVKARKFALLFSLGSLLSLGSMSMMKGPGTYFMQMFARDQWIFSSVYLCSLLMTLYAACVLRMTIPTAFFGIIQMCALATSLINTVPGGATGLHYIFKIFVAWFRSVVVPSVRWIAPKLCTCIFGD